MIRMKSGASLIEGTLRTPSSGSFETKKSVEERLISIGVAEKVEKVEEVAPPKNDNDVRGASINPPKTNNPNENNRGHLDKEQLETMTNKHLKQLAEDMGIDTSQMRVKKDYISAITSVDVEIEEDGDEPPTLDVEDPV